jgi:phospholipid transport system substrate-binding protein
MNKLKHVFVALALAAFTFASDRVEAETQGPRQMIDRFHATLLAAARDSALGYSGRYGRLMAEVERTFHLPVMTQVSAGNFWNDAQALHRRALIAAFAHYGVSLLARNFSGDGIERFETTGEQIGPQNTVLVDARIVRKTGSDIHITYVLKPQADAWRAVDVVFGKGISKLAFRRSEFSHQLANGGLPALTAALDDKADELAKADSRVEQTANRKDRRFPPAALAGQPAEL